MYSFKVGDASLTGYLTLPAADATIKYSNPVTLSTTNWVMFGRHTALTSDPYSLWRLDPNGTLSPQPFTVFTGMVHWVASDHSGGFVYVTDRTIPSITAIDFTNLSASGAGFNTGGLAPINGFLMSLDDSIVMHGAAGGHVIGFLTANPNTQVLTADLTTVIAGISVTSMAEISNTNCILVGVHDGTNGHVITLDYSNPGVPFNPGNVAISTFKADNLHY